MERTSNLSPRAANLVMATTTQKSFPKGQEEYIDHPSRRSWNCSTVIAIVSSVLVAILLFTVASLYDREPPINYTPVITTDLQPGAWPIEESGKEVIADCGSNPAEAQAKGCVWYLVSFSWTHPACYNKKISDEFLEKHGSFKFHANINKKPAYELSQEDLCDRGDQDSSGLG